MDGAVKQELRVFLAETLEKHGDRNPFSDGESLFLSGRLDSFSMMNLVMHLEERFRLDFSTLEFDVGLVDTLEGIVALVDASAH